MIRKFTVGADPELFIFNTATKTVVSSAGIIPGLKGEPWVDPAWPKGFGLEIDNILAEFNIPPCTTKEEFVNNIVFMKNYIRDFVKKINPNYDIRCRASYIVPEDQLQSEQAKLFGCSVDFNAYTEEPNPKPDGEKTNLRSSGFHLHLGYDNPNVETSLLLVKYFDAFLGVPSVLLDGDTKRRNLYGKAGAFRLTDYGLEYRSLSSVFLKTKTNLNFVWDGIMRVIKAYNLQIPLPPADEVQAAINNSDSVLAKQLIDKYHLTTMPNSKYVENPIDEIMDRIADQKIAVGRQNVGRHNAEIVKQPVDRKLAVNDEVNPLDELMNRFDALKVNIDEAGKIIE